MPGYTPAHTNQGWPIALGVVALAVALWIAAWMIHRNTYVDPRDPMAPVSAPAPSSSGAGGH